MILLTGDSLAVGASSYLHVRAQATVGIGSTAGARRLLDERLPRVVVVSLGTNDAPGEWRTFRRNVQRVRRHAPGCVVWLTIALPGHDRFNAVLRMAARRPGFELVPWAAMVRSGRVHLVDGVHPFALGYRVLARGMRRAIERCPT